ncbi:hypothetical protein ITJ54_09890 [Curtobacterium sp. VKM Ac-2865]|uniref:hypothetical protein n=1 Tax=Curtobacterium sp. VKM Ac-2865 TaxID=2783817 RepID=UPI00188B12DE|nr:hypothetical protein [Curtobacterium sp. VKM Ac-2865]MBF4582978.1 hypothetical protein [Curtobacterium sp. VKM Ac-2865]
MSGAADATTAPADRVPGSDRIGTAALVHTAQVVAAEALGSSVRDVRARVADDGRGALAVTVTAPLVMPALGARSAPRARARARASDASDAAETSGADTTATTESVVARTHRARATVAEWMSAITGRQVQRVDVTFTSSVVDTPRRVR